MIRHTPQKPPEKTRRPTHEELRVWEEVTREDQRLMHAQIDWDAVSDAIVIAKAEKQPPQKDIPHRPAPEQLAKLLAQTTAGTPAQPSAAGQPSPRPGIDRLTARRLRQGKLQVEATLDLHGMIRQEAMATLQAFLLRAQKQGKRCVLVITGKGRMSKEGGVLRRELPQWLELPPCRDVVLSFSPARQADGGEGAFYVLLRRQKTAS